MRCSVCNNKIEKNDEFCPFCGVKQNRKRKTIIITVSAVGILILVVLLVVFASWLMKNIKEISGIHGKREESILAETEQEEYTEEMDENAEMVTELEYEICIQLGELSKEEGEEIKANIYKQNESTVLKECILEEGDNTISLPVGSYILRIVGEQYEAYEKSFEIKTELNDTIVVDLVAIKSGIETDNLVVDAFYEAFTNRGYTYEYAIPKIESEMGDIPAINEEIYETFYTSLLQKDLVNPNLAFPTVGRISYKWYVNETTLSLIIEAFLNDFGVTYEIYCVDLNDGHLLSNEELLEMKEIDSRTYQETLKGNLQTAYIDRYSEFVEKGSISEEGYRAGLEATMADENIERAQLLLNSKGELCATCTIYSVQFDAQYFMNMETCQLEDYDEWP